MEDDDLINRFIMEETRQGKRKRLAEDDEEWELVDEEGAVEICPVGDDDDSREAHEAFPPDPHIVTTEDLDDFMELMASMSAALRKYELKHPDRHNFPGHRAIRTAVWMIWHGMRDGLEWLDVFTGFSVAHAQQKDVNARILKQNGLLPPSKDHNQ